jgi:hypothetical protein
MRQAKAYAKEVGKIRNDFDAKKIALLAHEIRRTVEELMAQAFVQTKASS